MTLGERILIVRRRRHMSQRELAEAAGLSTNTIARLEQGVLKDLGGGAVGRLARALHTSTDYLLGLTEDSGVESRPEPTADGETVFTTVSGSVSVSVSAEDASGV